MKFQSALSFLSIAGLVTALPTNDAAIVATSWGESCSLPDKLEWKNNYSFKDGNGHSEVYFRDNGDVRFVGRFHANSALALDYAITCGIRDSAANSYTITQKGTMFGTAAQGNKDSVFDITKNHPSIRKHWREIVNSGKLHCSVKTNVDVRDTLKEVTGLIGQYGPLNGEVIILI
jgi:hypothetical protein